MQIIINHLTRMSAPRICVAGVDSQSFEHVRPTTPPTDLITRNLLLENGGPFGVGAVVDLGTTIARPNAPEVEDYEFVAVRARLVEHLADDDYLGVLAEISENTWSEPSAPSLSRRATPNGP